MSIVCWQMILMINHTLFFQKLGKMSQKLSSAVVVIGALSANFMFLKNCSGGKRKDALK